MWLARHRRVFGWVCYACVVISIKAAQLLSGTTTATAATLPHATNANLTLKNTRRKERERERRTEEA